MEIESVVFQRDSRDLRISFFLKLFFILLFFLTLSCCGFLIFLVLGNREFIVEILNFVISVNFTRVLDLPLNTSVNLTESRVVAGNQMNHTPPSRDIWNPVL